MEVSEEKQISSVLERSALAQEIMILINKRLFEKKYIPEEVYRKTNELLIT